jgi:hypothetical protein
MKRLFSSRGSNFGQGTGLPCPANWVVISQQAANDFIFPTLEQLHVVLYGIQTVETNLPYAGMDRCASGDAIYYEPHTPLTNTETTGIDEGEGEQVIRPITLPSRRLTPAYVKEGEVQADHFASFKEPFQNYSDQTNAYGTIGAGSGYDEHKHLVQVPIQDFWNGLRESLPGQLELANAVRATGEDDPLITYWLPSEKSGKRAYFNDTLDETAAGRRFDGYEYTQQWLNPDTGLVELSFESIEDIEPQLGTVWNYPTSADPPYGCGYVRPRYFANPSNPTQAEVDYIISTFGSGYFQKMQDEDWLYSYKPENMVIDQYGWWSSQIWWSYGQAPCRPPEPGHEALAGHTADITLQTAQLELYAFYVGSFKPENFVGFHTSPLAVPDVIITVAQKRLDWLEHTGWYNQYFDNWFYAKKTTARERIEVQLGSYTDAYLELNPINPLVGRLEESPINLNGVDFKQFRYTWIWDPETPEKYTFEVNAAIVSINAGFTDFTPTLDAPPA